MPEISVIMGVYNELNKDILMEAVNSILHQTFEDFEFIIYDDGSCPEAATLLREVEGLDERIKLIGQDENHGLAPCNLTDIHDNEMFLESYKGQKCSLHI